MIKAGPNHGMSETREYRIWMHMRQRCRLPSHIQFADYGGRGIRVCEEWDRSFPTFLRDMGLCPPGQSIDRLENDGNYEPGNCRWATRVEQNNNQRRNIAVEHGGRVQTIAQWSRELGLRYATLHRRIVIKGESSAVAFRSVT